MIVHIVVSTVGAAVVAGGARAAGWLADARAVAATIVVGGAVIGFGGYGAGGLLLAFFISSALWSRLPRGDHHARSESKPRRANQVMANGGVAAVIALAIGWAHVRGMPWEATFPARMALAGALAAATADTWATEIGTWWGATPRSVITGRPMQPGESGGVTPAGTLGAMMGAAWIGLGAYVVWPDVGVHNALFIEAAGVIGAGVDSVLGATVQYKAACSVCERFVEDADHPHPVQRVQGRGWVNNDVVNAVATVVGAGVIVWLTATG